MVLLRGTGPGQLLADDQLGDVDAIAQHIRDDLLGIGQGVLRGSGMGEWGNGGMEVLE